MSDKILKLNQAQTLYNDLRERIEALPTDSDIPTKISDLTDDSGHYIKPATGIPASDLEEEIVSTIDSKAPAIYCEKSGAIVSFDDGAGNMLLKDCVVQIEPVQEGTGDPSPENVRPITGWTGCRVEHSGKNMLPTASYTDAKRSVIAATMDAELGRVLIGKTDAFTISGVSTAVQSDGNVISINVYYSDGTSAITAIYRGDQHVSGALTGPWAIPLTTGKTISDVHLGGTTGNAVVTLTNLQLEFGSTATDYEPYQGETYDITFPAEAGTIYGGTLDLVSGVLTAEYVMLSQWDDSAWAFYEPTDGAYGGNGRVVISESALASAPKGSSTSTLRTNYCKSTSNLNEWSAYVGTTGNIRLMIPSSITNKATLLEYLSEHPIQICYELATPIEYPLTPQQITALVSTNNIWADIGDTTVTYPVDTKMFVEQNAPDVPVQDVQINGVSVLTDGVANVPIAANGVYGVIRNSANRGIGINANGELYAVSATQSDSRNGTAPYVSIVPSNQHLSIFYGLAKAAGADMKDIANTTVGTYPDTQKEAIQSMLGITQMLAPENPNLVASQAYSIGDVFAANGHLYKATAAIAQDGAIIPDTNCVETTMVDAGGKIKDVQVNGVSIVQNGVADVPVATASSVGVVRTSADRGTRMTSGILGLEPATSAQIKAGTQNYSATPPSRLHEAAFYGLAKAAGDTTQSQSSNAVGAYTDEAKTAIKAMLGVQDGLKVVRLI